MRSRWIFLLVASLGMGCANMTHGEDKESKESDEVKIKFAEAPAAVQATLKKESNNAAIETVDKETDDGKTIYETDVTLDGKNYEIKVAEDGKLISKKVEEDEKEEKEEGKGKKEKD